MITEKIIMLIDGSDMMPTQKLIAKAKIERIAEAELKNKDDKLLIEQVADEKRISEVVFSNDEVKIYTVFSNKEWDMKSPYRSIYLNKDGAWRRSNTLAPTLDLALLIYLQHKHLGLNSQFVNFAAKMLEIKID